MPCKRCGNKVVENQETGLCGTCGADDRKLAARRSMPETVYRIPKESDKQKKGRRTYTKKRKDQLIAHPNCQVRLQGCQGKATEVHHTKGRGIHLNEQESFLSACDHCHKQLHDKMSAAERRERGFRR